jgi:demethylmenaquinone methyltransferase/2-methoxy-6-polyprenyl-1,4-benzoquinol methylase
MQPKDNAAQEERSQKIQAMFNDISHRYDLLNFLLSAGRDRSWRRRAVKKLNPADGSILLDLACGTGDVGMTACRYFPKLGKLRGMDFSENMLTLARKKFDNSKITVPYSFSFADARDLPLEDETVDNITIAFGIRNVVDVPKALGEMQRVLSPGGKLMIIEFAPPRGKIFGPLFHWYFHNLMPLIGGIISGNRAAYDYLPKSVGKFYTIEELSELMGNAGFEMASVDKYTFGVTVAYLGQKVK